MKRSVSYLLSALTALCAPAAALRAQSAPPAIYAQALVDHVVASHPELDKVSIHTFHPDAPVSTSCIIAAKDPSKPGDPDDDEDFAVLTLAKANFYQDKDTGAFKGLLPLLNSAAEPVGSLTMARKYTTKEDEQKFSDAMTAIRDELKVYIPNQACLFETGKTVRKNYAQTLVDYVMAAHPDLVRMSLHVVPPGAPACNQYVIAGMDKTARHLIMVGSVDDGEDYAPLTTGKPSFFFVKERGFYKGLLPLNDKTGRSIGVLLLGCKYTSKEDEPKFNDMMTVIRNQLQVHIPSRGALFKAAE